MLNAVDHDDEAFTNSRNLPKEIMPFALKLLITELNKETYETTIKSKLIEKLKSWHSTSLKYEHMKHKFLYFLKTLLLIFRLKRYGK